MRAEPGLQAFLAGLRVFLGVTKPKQNILFENSLQPTLRKLPKYETYTIFNSTIATLPLPHSIHQLDHGVYRPMQAL
jgi:hypothetical protein